MEPKPDYYIAYPLSAAMGMMLESRARNADVFAVPTTNECFLYVHEEAGELWRAAQNIVGDHLRANPLSEDEAKAKAIVEAGDLLYMVLSTLHRLGIDPDEAYQASIAKIDARCAKRRMTR